MYKIRKWGDGQMERISRCIDFNNGYGASIITWINHAGRNFAQKDFAPNGLFEVAVFYNGKLDQDRDVYFDLDFMEVAKLLEEIKSYPAK